MRILFTAAYFLFFAYLIYIDAPSRLMFAAVFVYLAGYFLITFIENLLVEFRKELARDKDND